MNKKRGEYIIDVIPLVRVSSAKRQVFSYLWDVNIPAGSLAVVPFLNRKINGIVLKSHEDFARFSQIKLKKIDNILEENFLTPEQLELARFISDFYICSLGVVLKAFIPKRIKARIKNYELKIKNYKKIILTNSQENAVNEIAKNHSKFKIQNSKFLLFGPASSGKTEVYINAISKIKNQKSKNQFLVLLPELTLTPQAVERYGAIFKPEEIAIIHSKISKGQLYDYWQKIKSGEIKLVIGTRMAVFAPFKNLKLIVIDEEQDISFKQWDMNPRYDARTVAEKLAGIYKAKIIRGSATPSVESFYKAINNEYELLELPRLDQNVLSIKYNVSSMNKKIHNTLYMIPNTQIVDMRKERWVKNFSCISKKLKSEIAFALKNKLQTILFINRQGMSSFSICEKCKSVLRCLKCDRALVYENRGIYKCLHCSYKSDAFAACPNCQNMTFRNIGLGTQKVEREIQKLFPEARILRADSETAKKIGPEKIYQDFNTGKYDILIGTQMITKGWDNPQVALIGIIDADNLLSIPDFRGGEQAFNLMVQVAGRVSRPGSRFAGQVLIQTFQPDNLIIKEAVAMDYEKFYAREIEERKILNYPPFFRLIKLICQDHNLNKVEIESKKLYDKLTNLKEELSGVHISRPQNPLVSQSRGQYKKMIILKFKGNLPIKLEIILKALENIWTIDVDPINLN